MSVLPYQTIKALSLDSTWDEESQLQDGLIFPFMERTLINGKTYGVSGAGYDIRIKLPPMMGSAARLRPGSCLLASSIERIKMPDDLIAIVHDKSTWARVFVACQNTVLEPGWEGWLTLEITTHQDYVTIHDGDPIAQLLFHRLEEPTEKPYKGKYQNQANEPVPAIAEYSGVDVGAVPETETEE